MTTEVEHLPKVTWQEESAFYKKLKVLDIPSPKGEKVLQNGRREWFQKIHTPENPYADIVVVVIAHPDDEAFVGGIISKLTKKGKQVIVIALTDGAAGTKHHTRDEMVSIRRNEESNALDILGAHLYINLGFPDGKLSSQETEARDALIKYFRVFDPKVVIAHRDQDYHHDHRAVAHITEEALLDARNAIDISNGIKPTNTIPAFYVMDPQGLKTELGEDTKDITMIVNISDEIDRKLKAFAQHKSQVENVGPDKKNYIEKSREEAKKRGKEGHFSYGEALKQISYGGEKFTQENILGDWFGNKEYTDKRKKKKIFPM